MFLTGGGGDGQGGLGRKQSRVSKRGRVLPWVQLHCLFCTKASEEGDESHTDALGWQTPNYKMVWSQRAVLEHVAQALALASG